MDISMANGANQFYAVFQETAFAHLEQVYELRAIPSFQDLDSTSQLGYMSLPTIKLT